MDTWDHIPLETCLEAVADHLHQPPDTPGRMTVIRDLSELVLGWIEKGRKDVSPSVTVFEMAATLRKVTDGMLRDDVLPLMNYTFRYFPVWAMRVLRETLGEEEDEPSVPPAEPGHFPHVFKGLRREVALIYVRGREMVGGREDPSHVPLRRQMAIDLILTVFEEHSLEVLDGDFEVIMELRAEEINDPELQHSFENSVRSGDIERKGHISLLFIERVFPYVLEALTHKEEETVSLTLAQMEWLSEVTGRVRTSAGENRGPLSKLYPLFHFRVTYSWAEKVLSAYGVQDADALRPEHTAMHWQPPVKFTPFVWDGAGVWVQTYIVWNALNQFQEGLGDVVLFDGVEREGNRWRAKREGSVWEGKGPAPWRGYLLEAFVDVWEDAASVSEGGAPLYYYLLPDSSATFANLSLALVRPKGHDVVSSVHPPVISPPR